MPKVYCYHEVTKEFLCEDKARIDPLESELTETLVWLLPANSTFIAPPLAYNHPGFVWCFKDGEWLEEEDNRGLIFKKSDASPSLFNKLGEIPEGYTTFIPPSEFPKWDGEKWVIDEERVLKEKEESIIRGEMDRLLREQVFKDLKERGVI